MRLRHSGGLRKVKEVLERLRLREAVGRFGRCSKWRAHRVDEGRGIRARDWNCRGGSSLEDWGERQRRSLEARPAGIFWDVTGEILPGIRPL